MRKTITINTKDKMFIKLTEQVADFAKQWGETGLVSIYSQHTTCCVSLLEDELLHKADVRFFLDKVAPRWKEPEGDQKNIKYLHDLISLRNDVPEDEPINGHSHIRSLFFNSSEMVPIEEGKLLLGRWKDIFLVELDPNRERKIILTFIRS